MTKYYICREPAIGADQNAPPVAVGHTDDYEAAVRHCDNHNKTMGPGLRVYVVPADLMWTDEEVNAT